MLKFFTTAIITIILISCSGSGDMAGATSETTNGFITATILEPDGTPAKSASVYLRKAESEKWLDTTLTDTLGTFLFDSLEENNYSVKVITKTSFSYDIDSLNINSDTTDIGEIITESNSVKDSLIVAKILSDIGITRDISKVSKKDSITGRIYELNLDNLSDEFETITADIQYLNLEKLSVGGNALTKIPNKIGKLKNLQYLDLSRNKLNSIPNTIANLDNCYFIDIANNEIETLPKEIMNMKSIAKIYLNNNRLKNLDENMTEWINEHSIDNKWENSQSE